jgi:DNA-binding SARP family transcriptional activator/Tfp pilus assembly protein PilF
LSDPALFLFGAPRLERRGKPVQLDTRKALALVAYLGVTRARHSRDALATLLWGDYAQSRARAALRRTLSVLNSALGGEQLEIDRENIGLGPRAALWIDVHEFQNRLAETGKHKHPPSEVCPRCIPLLSKAVALYRDDFMAGFSLRDSPSFDEWQFFQNESFRRDLASALEKLTRYHHARVEFEPATVYARRWLTLDPLHEPAHRELIELYARTGQRAAALRQYQECARILQEELGVAPLEETTRLYQDIKEQRLKPAEPPPVQVDLPLAPRRAPALDSRSEFPLVGRDQERSLLLETHRALQNDGHWVILEGEAGIGKTRLGETFLAETSAAGAHTVTVRFYRGGANLAYGPFIEGLRAALSTPGSARTLEHLSAQMLGEAARMLPELRTLSAELSPPPPLDSPGAASRFLEGIRQVLLALTDGPLPAVLFIDDLQWADAASVDFFTYMIQRLPGHPLLILSTWRAEDIPANHRLRQALTDAERAGTATLVPLKRLSATDVAALAEAVPGAPHGIGDRLYRETEGLAYFVVEYLSAIGQAAAPAAGARWSLPGGVRNLLQSRTASISETGRQLLGAAAVIGRSFDFDTLRAASGRTEEEVIAGLEELIARGLIKPIETGSVQQGLAYDFNHEKLRDYVYEETSLARRRLLHRRVAESLLNGARPHRETGARAGLIAFHYHQAGLTAPAAEYYRLAGDHARAFYANAKALEHFRTALALGHPEPAALHEAMGDVQTLMGDYGAAAAAFETAAQLSPRVSAALEHKRGNLHLRRGEWELAEEHFQAALQALGESGHAQDRARLWADWSLVAHRQNQGDQARTYACRALELAETANDLRALAQAHNILGILESSAGHADKAQEHLQTSSSLAESLGDPAIRVAALNNLALAFRGHGDLQRAIESGQAALDLCISVGDRHREAALHNNLADLYHMAGQSEVAMQHLKQAVSIFAEIGAEAGDWQPEIWKLVEW